MHFLNVHIMLYIEDCTESNYPFVYTLSCLMDDKKMLKQISEEVKLTNERQYV